MLDGLADHFELGDRRVLPHSIGEEGVATRLGYSMMSLIASRMCSR
jgi:hypothetical protein